MPQRVLIVDDQDELRALLVAALESSSRPMEVVESRDGHEALAALRAGPADLVVTDLDMPGMNGIELIRHLRIEHPQLPVVVISGASGDWIEQRGADEIRDLPYLRKPLVIDELLRTIESLLVT